MKQGSLFVLRRLDMFVFVFLKNCILQFNLISYKVNVQSNIDTGKIIMNILDKRYCI